MKTTGLGRPVSRLVLVSSDQSRRATVRARDCTQFCRDHWRLLMKKRAHFAHFISTPAIEARCRRCRRRILSAIDAGIPAKVECEPIARCDELAALLDNKWTFAMGTSGCLIQRDASAIAARDDDRAIYVEHRCAT